MKFSLSFYKTLNLISKCWSAQHSLEERQIRDPSHFILFDKQKYWILSNLILKHSVILLIFTPFSVCLFKWSWVLPINHVSYQYANIVSTICFVQWNLMSHWERLLHLQRIWETCLLVVQHTYKVHLLPSLCSTPMTPM